MKIVIIDDQIHIDLIREIAQEFYGDMIKGVVDLEQEIVALGGEYHMDANMKLIEHGSQQPHVWGFNIYLDKEGDEMIEYTSLINIRP
jgi:hypothetical protein